MTDTYADGFLDGWATAAETLRTRFHLTARDATAGPRIDGERLGGIGGHSDLPEGKPWLVGPQEPLRVPTFVPRVWAEVDSHPEAYTPGSIRLTPTDLDALADCDSLHGAPDGGWGLHALRMGDAVTTAKVYEISGAFQAYCVECAWEGPQVESELAAELDVDEHDAEMHPPCVIVEEAS